MASLFSLTLLIMLSLFWINQCEGCINALYWHNSRRKKRETDAEHEHVSLQDYFTQCMDDMTEDLVPAEDWRTVVGFGVDHSEWYQLTSELPICSNDMELANAEQCWVGEVEEALVEGTTRTALIGCIRDYIHDLTHYENHHQTMERKKRSDRGFLTAQQFNATKEEICLASEELSSSVSSLTSSVALNLASNDYGSRSRGFSSYVRCLRRQYPGSDLNLRRLANFIRSGDIVEVCDLQRNPAFEGIPTWPYHFIVLTKSRSRLAPSLKSCAIESYPPRPRWSAWGPWSSCPVTCGRREESRTRTCLYVTKRRLISQGCPGSSIERRQCRRALLPCTTYSWGQFGPYLPCSKTCGGGRQSRQRPCLRYGIHEVSQRNCVITLRGSSTETRSCNTQKCPNSQYSWTSWSSHTPCRLVFGSRGSGTQRWSRRCLIGNIQASSLLCPGIDTETRRCLIASIQRSIFGLA